MADTNVSQGPPLLSMAQQFTGLPMKSLIGGPLMAAAQANGAMGTEQVNFLMKTCFEPQGTTDDSKPQTLEPIMISLILERSVITPASDDTDAPNISKFSTTFDLPLLTILPLNSLAVDNVDISFTMEVKSSYSEDNTSSTDSQTKGKATMTGKAGWGPYSVSISGSLSHSQESKSSSAQHYQKSNSAEYQVKVHAGQLPLPPGVTTIIQAYSNNIQPITLSSGKADNKT